MPGHLLFLLRLLPVNSWGQQEYWGRPVPQGMLAPLSFTEFPLVSHTDPPSLAPAPLFIFSHRHFPPSPQTSCMTNPLLLPASEQSVPTQVWWQDLSSSELLGPILSSHLSSGPCTEPTNWCPLRELTHQPWKRGKAHPQSYICDNS